MVRPAVKEKNSAEPVLLGKILPRANLTRVRRRVKANKHSKISCNDRTTML